MRSDLIFKMRDIYISTAEGLSIVPRILESSAGCRTMFLFVVFCKIGELERNAY